jgi:integrase
MNELNDLATTPHCSNPVVLRKVMPRKPKTQGQRKHLTPAEVAALLLAAKDSGRYRLRDELAVTLAYRHGLRASELVGLQWSQVDLKGATLTIARAKGGMGTQHPLRALELRLLVRLRRDQPQAQYVLMSERGAPWTTSNWRKVLDRLAGVAGAAIGIKVNPHSLRHACGFYLASRGVDTRALSHYLGHRSLQSTELYTAQSAGRFKDFWED